jgi:diguanylate cyclase (GGDEF)-like protein
MPIAIIYAVEPPQTLMRVFSECSCLEAELVEYAQAQEKLRSDWQPEAIICELHEENMPRSLLSELTHRLPETPIFSFSIDRNSQLQERSAALGFIAHLDGGVTSSELQLHLRYGKRMVGRGISSRLRIEQALSAVTSLHFSLDISNVIESALETLPRLIQADCWALFVSSQDSERLEQVGEINAPPSLPIELADDNRASLLVHAALSGRPLIQDLVAEPSNDLRYSGGEYGSVICLPLHTHARLFGVLEALTYRGNGRFSAEDLELGERVAVSLAVALSNATNFASAERLCQIDDLTQLYNSRYLHQVLESEVRRSRRYKIPISVIFLDLDGFKLVNDMNGHLCGSATLTEVANLMMGLVRDTDIVARYGGDEFVIVLPETPAERAVTIAERIRKQIEAHVFRGGGDSEIYLTASFGVASYPEHASSPAALIRCADKAMYMAKESNKNQVILAN